MNAIVEQTQPPQNVTPLPMQQRTQGEADFALVYRKAKALAASTIVPEQYRGEAGLPNVMIALEVAERIGANALQVMQSLYIVHGRPSWSSSFLIATVNACKRFTPLRFEVRGDDPSKDDYRVRAYAIDKESGERCDGAWITWTMVKAENWHSKAGSKWKTLPEQMFMYRAAAFWTRVYAPELSLGIHTTEEVQDFAGPGQGRAEPSRDLSELSDVLARRAALEHQPTETSEQGTGDIIEQDRSDLDQATQ
jgi:hypothetical protein